MREAGAALRGAVLAAFARDEAAVLAAASVWADWLLESHEDAARNTGRALSLALSKQIGLGLCLCPTGGRDLAGGDPDLRLSVFSSAPLLPVGRKRVVGPRGGPAADPRRIWVATLALPQEVGGLVCRLTVRLSDCVWSAL